MVVGVAIGGQRVAQLKRAGKAGLGDKLTDAAIEALNHAVGLGMAGRVKPVPDTQGAAAHVKGMPSRGHTGLVAEAIGKRRAVTKK
jgi:hypothetical protein